MKITAVKLSAIFLIFLAVWSTSGVAQVNTMYVMKNGVVVFQSPVSGVDSMTFDQATSDEALIIHKNEDSPVEKILLNNIQQFSFSDENLSVEMSGGDKMYAFSNIAKLLFVDVNNAGINYSTSKASFDVLLSFIPGGDMVVESNLAIKSLTLFSLDGKLISKLDVNDVETKYTISLQGVVGVYLLRITTGQGTVIKKIVKP